MKAKEKIDHKTKQEGKHYIPHNATEVKKQEKVKIHFCKAHRNGMTVQMVVTVTIKQQYCIGQ